MWTSWSKGQQAKARGKHSKWYLFFNYFKSAFCNHCQLNRTSHFCRETCMGSFSFERFGEKFGEIVKTDKVL